MGDECLWGKRPQGGCLRCFCCCFCCCCCCCCSRCSCRCCDCCCLAATAAATAAGKTTPRGFEPLRAEPSRFRVHLLSHSDTVSHPPCQATKNKGTNLDLADIGPPGCNGHAACPREHVANLRQSLSLTSEEQVRAFTFHCHV